MENLIDIGYTKTCDCKGSNLNCMTGKEWVRNQVAIWELYYEKRDIRKKEVHPASFPISLPRRCIDLFSHPGELIIDPFMGIGSTLLAAQDSGRNAVGFDLNQTYVDVAIKRLEDSMPLNLTDTKQIPICDDALNIHNYFNEETISLAVTSPPYADLLNRERLNKTSRSDKRHDETYKKNLQYSSNPRDLGTMRVHNYIKSLSAIYEIIRPLLKPKAHCVINVNDLWQKNKRYPIHCSIIEVMENIGYELRNIIIWDKRKLVNRVGIFGYPSNYITFTITFEYILDFWRSP